MAQRYFFVGSLKPIVDLTATSNSELFLVGTNDEKDKNYQLSTTDYYKNDETKDSIDHDK